MFPGRPSSPEPPLGPSARGDAPLHPCSAPGTGAGDGQGETGRTGGKRCGRRLCPCTGPGLGRGQAVPGLGGCGGEGQGLLQLWAAAMPMARTRFGRDGGREGPGQAVAGGSLWAPPSWPGQAPAAGEGRVRHFCCRTQRSGVGGEALRVGVPPRHPTRRRRVRGCLRGQAGPGQQPSPCRSRRAPGPLATPQHPGAGAKAGGAPRGGRAAAAAGAAPRGGSVVGALHPLHPGSLTPAPGWICPSKCPCGMEVPLAHAGDPSAVAASGHGAGGGAVLRAVGSPWRRAQRRCGAHAGVGSCSAVTSPLFLSYAAPVGVLAVARRGRRGRAHMLSASW